MVNLTTRDVQNEKTPIKNNVNHQPPPSTWKNDLINFLNEKQGALASGTLFIVVSYTSLDRVFKKSQLLLSFEHFLLSGRIYGVHTIWMSLTIRPLARMDPLKEPIKHYLDTEFFQSVHWILAISTLLSAPMIHYRKFVHIPLFAYVFSSQVRYDFINLPTAQQDL